ncbi:extracellular solute-binding protein [Paenibacillus yanchengensis]|uniref:Extracellular solute-binding protein n=1 Tax=Paenibacillus yanchengensis TaxID=2035833 RepID=A0ABW4YM63_9BACL
MKAFKKNNILGILILVFAMIISACGSTSTTEKVNKEEEATKATETATNTGKQQVEESKQVENEPATEINIMTVFFTPEPIEDNDPIKLEIEKNTNTKLNITWISSNNYVDKANVTLASGDIPDLMLVLDPFHPQVKMMSAQGAFWDLTDYIKDYDNLSKFPTESWENVKFKGKNYGIPRVRPLEGDSGLPLIRKDWLDQLQLPMPQTMDEFYEVLKAFTFQDPDQNNKQDTLGFTGLVSLDGMGNFGWVEDVFNGANGRWKLVNDELIDTTMTADTKQALLWLKDAFAEGLISPDFPTLKQSQVREMITTNKAGAFAAAVKPSWLLTGQMRKSNPDADIIPLIALEGPHGKYVGKAPGFYGMYLIPKKVSEQKMKKILQFMDYGATEAGANLASFGFEGTHYNIEEGIIVPTEQAIADNVGGFGHLFSNLDPYERAYQTGIPKDFLERNKQIIDEMAKISIASPAVGLHSDTYVKVGKDYDKKIQDMKVKVMMGREPIETWDKFVESLQKDEQYLRIITEINEDYQQRNK